MENRVVKTETTKEMGLEKKTGARPSVVGGRAPGDVKVRLGGRADTIRPETGRTGDLFFAKRAGTW